MHAAEEPDDTDAVDEVGWGVIIEITYEKASYTAILLRDINGSVDEGEGGFTHLPLLLTRLPPPLRATLLDFLATRFDTRASPLHLPSPFLKKALGGYIDVLVAGGGDVKTAVRDVVISLAFPPERAPGGAVEGGGLKIIDLTIPRDDLAGFLDRGRNTPNTTTTANAAKDTPNHPLWTALRTYTTAHLALDLSHPSVSVIKIACGAFVMAGEGRVKISAPSDWRGEREGAEGVVGMLGGVASRTG